MRQLLSLSEQHGLLGILSMTPIAICTIPAARQLALALSVAFMANNVLAEPIAVENHLSGSTVRYSVVLLRGRLPGESTGLTIENVNAPGFSKPIQPLVHQGRFKALVPLTPGKNTIRLSVEGVSEWLELNLN